MTQTEPSNPGPLAELLWDICCKEGTQKGRFIAPHLLSGRKVSRAIFQPSMNMFTLSPPPHAYLAFSSVPGRQSEICGHMTRLKAELGHQAPLHRPIAMAPTVISTPVRGYGQQTSPLRRVTAI